MNKSSPQKMKHKAEPWVIVDDDRGWAAIESHPPKEEDRHIVFSFTEPTDFRFSEADSNRAVACVNALAGCPDPAKFVEAVAYMMRTFKRENGVNWFIDRELSWLKEKS